MNKITSETHLWDISWKTQKIEPLNKTVALSPNSNKNLGCNNKRTETKSTKPKSPVCYLRPQSRNIKNNSHTINYTLSTHLPFTKTET